MNLCGLTPDCFQIAHDHKQSLGPGIESLFALFKVFVLVVHAGDIAAEHPSLLAALRRYGATRVDGSLRLLSLRERVRQPFVTT